jgi:hypothetical protein
MAVLPLMDRSDSITANDFRSGHCSGWPGSPVDRRQSSGGFRGGHDPSQRSRLACAASCRRGLEQGKEVTHRLGQCRLVVLHRQDVVGAAIANGLGDVGLGAHGVDRDDTAFQRQGRQQFGNRRLLVRFLCRRPLPRTSPAPAAKALTRCSGVASTLPERRLVLPSMATTASVPRLGTIALTQRRKAASNSSGSIRPNRRPKGVVRGNAIFQPQVAAQPIQPFLRPQLNLNKGVGANQTPLTATTSSSTRSCSTLPACLGSEIDTNTSASRSLLPVSMAHPKKTENYTNQAPVNSPSATP